MFDTDSELVFNHVCERLGWNASKIPRTKERTPDFVVQTGNAELVVELKQADAPPEELARLEAHPKGEMFITHMNIGEFVRKRMGKAIGQFAAYFSCTELQPTLLIFYDNRPFMMGDPVGAYEIRTAMYGNDAIVLSAPNDIGEPPRMIERAVAQNGRMKPDAMTIVSAIGALRIDEDGVALDIFHNEHAKIPLSAELFSGAGIAHYRINYGERGEYADWTTMT